MRHTVGMNVCHLCLLWVLVVWVYNRSFPYAKAEVGSRLPCRAYMAPQSHTPAPGYMDPGSRAARSAGMTRGDSGGRPGHLASNGTAVRRHAGCPDQVRARLFRDHALR